MLEPPEFELDREPPEFPKFAPDEELDELREVVAPDVDVPVRVPPDVSPFGRLPGRAAAPVVVRPLSVEPAGLLGAGAATVGATAVGTAGDGSTRWGAERLVGVAST